MRGKDINKIAQLIDLCKTETPSEADIRFNEPMSDHTTFKVGGNADCFVSPCGDGFITFCVNLLNRAEEAAVPVFVLGGGANIVVSDKGIRGIVLDMSAWTGETAGALREEEELVFKSGTGIDEAVNTAACAGLCGFEFLAGMPGTIGGAVWMNARCYGKEMADVLKWAEIACRGAGNKYVIKKFEVGDGSGFDYKLSPFQKMDCLILSAAFKLKKDDISKTLNEMEKNRKDRLDKGHYLFPCAGSAFKNNRDFGKPAGQIIDELGLKGLKIGGAQVAAFHGNFIINTGYACASDIRALADEVAARVKSAAGFTLETEILFVGEWQ